MRMKLSHYLQGKVYSLDQIKLVTPQLKFILSRTSTYGLFFLYKQKNNNHLWVGGPFQGKDSNAFLYLGPLYLPKGLTNSFSTVIRRNLENDLKKLKERHKEQSFDLFYTDPMQLQLWSHDFFKFENHSFDHFFK